MNYRRHFFWTQAASAVGVAIGGLVWFVEAAIRMAGISAAKLPFDEIKWKMFAYPAIGAALAWFIVRVPLMARCEACGSRLRRGPGGTASYVCPHCGMTLDAGVPVPEAGASTAAPPQVAARPPAREIRGPDVERRPGTEDGMRARLAPLRQTLYPNSPGRRADWKLALGALCVMAVLSTCVRVTGFRAHILGFEAPVYLVWAIANIYLLIGVIWSLLDPQDEAAARAKGWRKLLLVGLGLLSALTGLLAPWLRPI